MTDLPVRARADIAGMPPYRPGDPAGPGELKLSSNESPFEPLPGVVAAMRSAIELNRYPDPSASALRARLAERFGVQPDAVHVSAGSVSILQQLALALTAPGDEIVFPWRSFEGYPWMAALAGSTAVPVPLRADGRHDLDAMAETVGERTRIVLVCSPNNPSGEIVRQADFDAFVERVPSDVLVVLDEAYAEFVTDPEAVDGRRVLAAGRANVMVLRTFSKAHGLASLRVGYAIGHPRILQAARIPAVPFTVSSPAQAAALASLDAEEELAARAEAVAERRDRLAAALRAVGWSVPVAQGNFVWLPAGRRSSELAERFRAAGLIVRSYGDDGVRVTLGEDESIERIVAVARALPAPEIPAR